MKFIKQSRAMEPKTIKKNGAKWKCRTNKKKLIRSLLTAFICLFAVHSYGQSWDIGYPNATDIIATYDKGTLTISGTGEMQDWQDSQSQPWKNVRDNIKCVVINEGVTTIGNIAFSDCLNLTSITLSKSITRLGNYAFQITRLKEIHIENPIPPTVGWACFWAVNIAECKLYVPSGTQNLYATLPDWCLFDIVGHIPTFYVQESEHFRLEIHQPLLSITPEQVAEWLSNLDRYYEQLVDLMGGLTPFEGRKMIIRSVGGINAWAYAGYPIQWNANYVSDQLSEFVKSGDWSFGILHEIGHNFGGHIGGFGKGNTSYNWNEEMFANFRMYLALSQLPQSSVEAYTDAYKKDYDCKLSNKEPLTCMWDLIRLGDYYQKNGDHGYWLFKQAFEIINSTPNTNENIGWTNWQRFNYFLDILSSCVGRDVRETYPAEELKLIRFTLDRNNFYDETLQTPTNKWQTVSDKILPNGYIIYRIFVTEGQKYAFKICCGNDATTDFDAKLSLYDNSGGDRIYPDLWNGDVCASGNDITDIEDYQFNYTGYAYVKVQGNSVDDYGNYTLAYQDTNLVAPINDQCANATFLLCGTLVQGTLAGATPTASISYRDDFDKNDVFYSFTATESGDYTITLVKSYVSDDINFGLYSSCDVVTPLAKGSNNTITYSCTTGTTYQIRVTSYSGGTFSIWLICQGETTDTGVIINGIKWATRNVGTPGVFTTNSEDTGWFYQWNRKIAWTVKNPLMNSNGGTIWDTSQPVGSAWTEANDPCPTEWRLPTDQEMNSLINSGSVWAEVNGVFGRIYGKGDNTIFLPAAGIRNDNGIFREKNQYGYYWTKSKLSDQSNPTSLEFADGHSSVVDWKTPSEGLCIRCVTKESTTITSINEPTVQQFQIFPNPTKNEIFIKSDSQIMKVEIYSLAGSLMLSETNFNGKISVSTLPKGIYMVRVYTDNGVEIGKIVKE